MGIAALVVGILSLVVFVFFGGAFSQMIFPISIVGIILGALARKNPETSIIALVLTILAYVAIIACIGSIVGGMFR